MLMFNKAILHVWFFSYKQMAVIKFNTWRNITFFLESDSIMDPRSVSYYHPAMVRLVFLDVMERARIIRI